MKKFISIVISLCMAISLMAMPVSVYAEDTSETSEYYTCKIGDKYYNTLSDAVASANTNDVITMINDETLTGAITFNKEITIDGDGHFVTAKVTGTDDMLVVNSNSSNYNMFINNSTGTLLKNLTIYGGRKSAIVNNQDKRILLSKCTISRSGTSAEGETAGGAIQNNGGKCFAKECNFSQNVADYGAGFLNKSNGIFVLDQCSITENRTVNGSRGGGAVENKGNSKLYLNNCTIANNQSYEIGGAINNNGNSWSSDELNAGSSIYMTNCTVTGNITTGSAAIGAGIGNNRGYVYAANTLLAYNQANVGGTPMPSDIGIPYIGSSAYSDSSYQSDGQSTFFRNCAYEAVVNGTNQSGAFNQYNDITVTEKQNIFSTLNKFGVLKANGGSDTKYKGIEHPGLVLDTTFYAPIKVNTPVVKGGTETYLCASDFSNILMAYKDADGVIRSLGNSSYITGEVKYTYTNDQKVDDVVASELETEHKVTTYQNNRTRAKGVIGAVGPTSKKYYTIHAEVPTYTNDSGVTVEPGTVNGVTIYGKTVEQGKDVTLTAKANNGYKFFNNGWTITDEEGNTYTSDSITDSSGNKTSYEGGQTVVPIDYKTSSVVGIGVTKDVNVVLKFEPFEIDTSNIVLNFEGITDSGYCSPERESDTSLRTGVISFNISLPEYTSYKDTIEKYGLVLCVDKTGTQDEVLKEENILKIVSNSNLDAFETQDGWFHIVLTDIPADYFDTKFYVVPFAQIDGKEYGNGGEAHTAIYTTVNSNTTGDDDHVKWLGETATYGDSNVDVSDNTVVLSFEELENAKAVK